MVTVGCAEDPSSAMPRPNMACSRRRQRRCTNVYSYVWPWRFIMAHSAARLRPRVGPLASRKADAGQTRQPDITGNNRPTSGHFRTFPGIVRTFPNISEHFRAFSDMRGASRAVSPVAGSRPIGLVACGIARRRIACRRARRVRYRSSPDTAGRMGVACGMACRRIACGIARRSITCRHVPARVGDLMSLPRSRSGAPNARRLPCPGPTYACSRRRQPLCSEHIFACTPWRFRNVRSAARLRRTVGPPSTRKAHGRLD